MSVSSIGGQAVYRLADSGARTVKVSELPGSAERADSLLDHLVASTQQQQVRVETATASMQREEANLARIQAIVDNLRGTASVRERSAWTRELYGARDNLRSAQDEFGLATAAQAAAPERLLRMQKFIAGHLGVSLEEAQAMYKERLDKIA